MEIINDNGNIYYTSVRLVLFNSDPLMIMLYPNAASVAVAIDCTINHYKLVIKDADGNLAEEKTNILIGMLYHFETSPYTQGRYSVGVYDQNQTLLQVKEFIKK